jgi:hypothetical protein
MRKKPPKRKPKPADTLIKTTTNKDIELTEKELGKVSGGISENLSLNFSKVIVEY